MLCPFCLRENTIKRVEEGGRTYYICSEHPEPRIPVIYGENYTTPRDVISAIGFRGHGKSAYFASLFSSLDDLARVWPNFFTFPIDEKALDTVHDNIRLLKGGKLPSATPVNFPYPTIVQFSKMPKFGERFLIFYDTGGENFERASRLVVNANFVKRSQTAIFFMSLHDLDYNPQEMARLLSVYIMGLKELGGDPRQQNLLVVLTKGDLLAPKLEKRTDVWNYLVNGDTRNLQYGNIYTQISEMKKISKSLMAFIRDDIGAANFVSLGTNNFRAVDFCIISALGSAPNGDQLDISAAPKRIFDPILWVMNNTRGPPSIIIWLKEKFFNQPKASQSSPARKSPVSIEKGPQSYRHIVNFLGGCLILGVIIWIMMDPGILSVSYLSALISALFPASFQPISPSPVITADAKDLAVRPYGDYLTAGHTNLYYFDIDSSDGKYYDMIKVFTQTSRGHFVTMMVGLNYIPSIENNKYDYIASTSTTSSDAVIQINDLKPGRYYVAVSGISGSGDTKVSRTLY